MTFGAELRGVDVHCHVVPETFPAYLRGTAPADWPSTTPAHACHRHVMIGDAPYRTVSDRCWDTAKRLEDMDAAGLTLQAASPMPELLSYWMEAQDALDLTRWLNEVLAEMAGASGERIIALGAVPLQDVDLACRELERLMAEPAFAGVEIGSNVNGRPIGAPEYEPFFALAEALGAAVFVHALRPTGMDRLVGPPALQQVLAYPTDVGLAAASVITTNLVVRHPKLRLAFSHGGGTLTSLLPRLERACEVFPKLGEQVIERPSAQARRLWADSLVFDAPMLRRVVSVFGEDRVMIGTDYPFNFRDADPLARLAAAVDDPALRRRLAVDNAMCFLGRKGDLG